MFKKNISLIIIILLIFISFVGCTKPKENKEINENKKVVTTKEISTSNLLEKYSTVGLASANKTYNLVGQTGAEVKNVYVKVGDKVTKNQNLFALDSDVTKRNAENSKKASLTQLQQAKLAYEDALENYNKNKKLFEQGVISKKNLDTISLNLSNKKLALENAQTNYNNTVKNLDDEIESKIIKSPIDGLVVSNNINKEDILNGQKTMSVMDLKKIKIKAQVSSEIINKIKVGQQVKISFDELNKNIDAKISQISYIGNNASYPIQIDIENDNLDIKPGMYCDIDIVLNEYKDVISIPKYSLLNENEKAYVFINDKGKAKKRYLDLGKDISGQVIVKNGLKVGQNLIIEGQNYIDSDDLIKE
ncbi:MAG: efflux RND transporter periplasmic adaptor subunit [Bacillota bacterium]